jgi:hypothetical protein
MSAFQHKFYYPILAAMSQAEKYKDKGNDAFKSKDYIKAIEYCM